MTIQQAMELTREALLLACLLCLPPLGAALLIGVIISLLQAVTQIQDQTLSFIPKLLAMVFVVLYTLPWVLQTMIDYMTQIYHYAPR
ncbi:MAG: flagellar biosynthesis protein FliQ [Planctomycetaceae bacterium]|nr:MAG: flagellar biosynthesis protein FliQ [Planctomycetaceae bacterium]